jgi:hypothetical protein
VLTYPATGDDFSCDAGQEYLVQLFNRRKKEVDELYALTGWNSPERNNYVNEYNRYLTPKTRENQRNENIPAIRLSPFTGKYITTATLLFMLFMVFLISGKQFKLKS